jgi:hypothetical protein
VQKRKTLFKLDDVGELENKWNFIKRSGWSPLGLIGSGFLKCHCVTFLLFLNDNSAIVLLERNVHDLYWLLWSFCMK